MKILLVMVFLVPFVYFGYLMTKLDNYLTHNSIAVTNSEENVQAVVLGKTSLAKEIIELLENEGMEVINLNDPYRLLQEQNLYYLFALSESDADNIASCKIGRKLYGIDAMISICNDSRNENMFISEGIDYVMGQKIEAGKILQTVLQQSEVKL